MLPNFSSCTLTPKIPYPHIPPNSHTFEPLISSKYHKHPTVLPSSQTPYPTSSNFHPNNSNSTNNLHQISPISSPQSYPNCYPYSNYLTTATSTISSGAKIKREDFKFMYQIGFGGFGKVWKVQEKTTWEYFAMKEIEKRKYILLDF